MALDRTFKRNTKESFKLVKKDVDQFKDRMDKWVLYLIHRVDQLEKRVKKLEK